MTSLQRRRGSSRLAGLIAVALAALFLIVPSFAEAAVEAPAAAGGNITITQTNSPPQAWCLPGFLVLTRQIRNTSEFYELIVRASTRPCEPIRVTAAIYGMPGNGVAWPQKLKETKKFTISAAGTTVIRFTKTCDPVQFDVITGATPESISPLGPWHGPLLFPFDMATSVQHWGCGSTTTTTTADPCENYAARQLAVSPTSVAAGGSVTVSGLGTPGTTLLVWLAPSGGSSGGGSSTTVAVPPSGQWSTQLTVPGSGSPGTWNANAQASDCEGIAAISFTVTGGSNGSGGGSNGTGGSSVPPTNGNGKSGDVLSSNVQVGGIKADRELPSGAVENASLSLNKRGSVGSDPSGRVNVSKLAWTGSNVRIPVVIGITLLMAGVLLLLRSRRTVAGLH